MKALLITLVVLIGLAVAADRVGVHVADQKVAQELQKQGNLSGTPTVDITGFPFLTQAFAGTYHDVRITLTASELGQRDGIHASLDLRGVHIPLSSALSGSVQQVPVDHLDGTATIAYSVLAAELGGDTTLRPEGDRLRLTKTVRVAGRSFQLTALGTLTLQGDEVVIDAQQASAVGVTLPSFLVREASSLLNLRYRIPALPFGLRISSLSPGAQGVVVHVAAANTVLHG